MVLISQSNFLYSMSFLLNSFKKKAGIRRFIGPKRIFLFVVLTLLLGFSWDSYNSNAMNPETIAQFQSINPIVAILFFIFLYAASVTALLPSLPLNLAAGFFWGGLAGGVYSTLGVTLGGWISFLLARALIGQPFMGSFNNKWANIVQIEFEKSRWKFVAFARINPIIPSGPLNYLLGLTSLSNKDFLWTAFIFLLPPSIAVAYIGDVLQTFVAHHSNVNDIVKPILIFSAAVTFLAGLKFAVKILKNK